MKKFISFLLLLIFMLNVRAQTVESSLDKGIAALSKKNYTAAYKYFHTEAQDRNPNAYYYLAMCYEKGWGTVKDPESAQASYEMAANRRPYDLKAISELIDICRTGRNGMTKDLSQAVSWSQLLIKLDDRNNYPDTYFYLADIYCNQAETQEDFQNAVNLIVTGKSKGSKLCEDAYQSKGLDLYNRGLKAYKSEDYIAAVAYYELAIELLHTDAMIALGSMYDGGVGVQKLPYKGSELYELAANHGSNKALKMLRNAVTNEHERFMLSGLLKKSNGSFEPLPFRYNGKGTIRWEDGTSYTGTCTNGKMTGEGKRYDQIGKLLCEGTFVNGLIHGEGIYYYSDGSIFKGTMIAGKRHFGELITTNGTYNYRGEWKEEREHGKGSKVYPDHTMYFATYVNGIAQGEGVVVFPDGNNAKGIFVDDEMKGTWDYSNFKTGFVEKRIYSRTGVFTLPEVQEERPDYTKANREYEEWWEKIYGKGGSQNRNPMPNNNIPQASYKSGKESESERHRKAMDKIYRETERDNNR